MPTKPRAVTLGIAATVLIATLAVPASAFQTSTPNAKPAGGVKPDEPPYTFEQLSRLLDKTKNSRTTFVTIQTVITLVRKNGVAFQPNEVQIEALRKKGATDEVITAVREKSGVPEASPAAAAPSEPPKPKVGSLTVTCKPVDCVVLVDKKAVGSTKKGELSGLTVPEGRVTISASSENYIPDKEGQVTEITDGSSVTVEFAFKLSPVALQARGGQLFAGMVEALGGEAGLRESQFLRAVGTLTVFSTGPQKLWPMTAYIQLPANARFEITKANENYVIIHTESGYDLSKSKSKNLKGQELEELEDALRRVQANQISRIVDRLRGSGVKMTAEKVISAPGEEAVFRVEQGPDTYIVTLGADSRPKEIKLESSGLNSGLKLLLSEYTKVGNAVIPHKTQVILPGTPSRGVMAQFETVTVNPSGVDFTVKKGNRVTGR